MQTEADDGSFSSSTQDQDLIAGQQEQYKSYAVDFPIWSEVTFPYSPWPTSNFCLLKTRSMKPALLRYPAGKRLDAPCRSRRWCLPPALCVASLLVHLGLVSLLSLFNSHPPDSRLISDDVKKTWDLPASWELKSQMVRLSFRFPPTTATSTEADD